MKEIDVQLEVLRRLCADPSLRSGDGGARLAAEFPGHEELVRELCARAGSSRATGEDPQLAGSIGGYRLVRHIGSGSMGDVYEAMQESPRRTVALKLLRPGLGLASRARFEREVEALSRMRHPGITRIYDAGIHESALGQRPYFVMELVSGHTLKRYRELLPADHRARDAETIRLLRSLCAAIQHAHEQGVIHRDIKPSNVLVDDRGQPKLIDFGIALFRDEELERLTRTRHFVGTEQYASPEQLRADRVVDERSDVYALGVLGRELARSTDPSRSRWKAVQRSELTHVLDKATAQAKGARYASAALFEEDLRRVSAREPTRARPPSVLYRAGLFVWRRPTLSLFGAGLLLVLSGALGAVLGAAGSAREASRNYERLARIDELERLRDDQEALWPALPARIDELRDWCSRCDVLLSHLAADAKVNTAKLLLAEPGSDRARGMQHLSAELAELVRTGRTARQSVEARLATALRVEAGWKSAANAWQRAVLSISDPLECPDYGGLEIAAQRGLRPIGRNPDSGLWEFEHLLSRTGEKSGLTLVLLPGGRAKMGAQAISTDKARYDRRALPRESARDGSGDLPEAFLDPFFVSKYELTVREWELAEGLVRGMYRNQFDRAGQHPITDVSWEECVEVLGRLDLLLPTEMQWEYSARAGADSAYGCGASHGCLDGHANLVGLDSAFSIHTAVDAYRPNAFGLHNVLGNAAEWCRDERSYFGLDRVRDGDGLFFGHRRGEGRRIVRGGGFNTHAVDARLSARRIEPKGNNGDDLGVRAVRPLDADRDAWLVDRPPHSPPGQ